MIVAAVLVAGALGALGRYGVTRAIGGRGGFPWAVLAVNVVGSAIGGAMLGLATTAGVGDDIRMVLLTGLCGGLTTFSTLSVDTVMDAESRRFARAALTIGGNLLLGVGAAAIAFAITARA